jgi:hypothetical protein
MWEILEKLRRVHGGDNHSAITRTTGRSPSTIRSYLAAASDLDWVPGRCEPTEAFGRQDRATAEPHAWAAGWRSRAAADAAPRAYPDVAEARAIGEAWTPAHEGAPAAGATGRTRALQLASPLCHEIGPSRNGSRSSMTRSSRRAPSIGSLTTGTRSWQDPATGDASGPVSPPN